jgi:hypothetical protein
MIFSWIYRIIAYSILFIAIIATLVLYTLLFVSIPYIVLPLFAFLALRQQDRLVVFSHRYKVKQSSNAKFDSFFVFLLYCFMFPLAVWVVLIEPIVFIAKKINSMFPVSN